MIEIELKARLTVAEAEQVEGRLAEWCGAAARWALDKRDTYFYLPHSGGGGGQRQRRAAQQQARAAQRQRDGAMARAIFAYAVMQPPEGSAAAR